MMLLAGVLATSAYAYTAAINGVGTPPNLGSGSGTINGFTAGAITYSLNATTPTNLDAVNFPLTGAQTAPTPTSVRIQLASGGAWYVCSVAAGSPPVVSCNTTSPQATAASATALTVVASNGN
jgi:hypothetical protein